MKIVLSFAFVFLSFSNPLIAREPQVEVIRLAPQICAVANQPLANGAIPEPGMVAKDAYCAKQLMMQHAPKGAVTVFGSARTKPDMEAYRLTQAFARRWTEMHGASYPILTGGGPGIMEAANRGAFEAKGKSLGIGTFFSNGQEKPNAYTTHAYMAFSFTQREADLVDYAAAIVVAPGGFGTEWEIYESLSKMQTLKKKAVPLILLGKRKDWTSFLERVEHMKTLATISPKDSDLIQIAENEQEAVRLLENKMGLQKKSSQETQSSSAAR